MQGRSWAWYCLFGSLLFLAGGLLNLLKVFKMPQRGGRGLEKLRGGAQERLRREREGKVPLILEEGRRGKHGGNVGDTWAPGPAPAACSRPSPARTPPRTAARSRPRPPRQREMPLQREMRGWLSC